ncbi:uncharacterized protein LOC118562519, partial [Fundulus heteroclitus]|uniref:uncharacterized protein LOC118562519 n=1 Tax=Fundulus heteroclitus TaxID=8078 RepID=UPI00165AA4A7
MPAKTKVASDQYIFPQNNANNRFTGISVISVPRSEASSYKCSLTHPTGEKSVQVDVYVISPPHVTLLSVPEGDKQVLVCSIKDFAPKQLSVSWKKNNNNIVTGFSSFNPQKSGAVYSAVSILTVDKTDWDNKAVYTCGVTHKEQNYEKKASKAPVTVKLSPPSPKAMFSNKQAELKCVVTGQDRGILSSTTINWYINGQQVTNGIIDGSNSGEKYSTLTRNLAEWKKVNTVSCSATIKDMTPVTQSLTVNRGNEEPNIEVQIAPNSTDSEVTLVCLVTSQRMQDYYIAWSESSGKDPENFTDGINLPTQKIRNSYLVSSLYTITKDSWNRNMFSCNVWPAGSDQAVKPRYVSRFSDHAAPVTVKLSPPSPKAMFSNKQAELKCVVTGQDRSILSDTNISWYINGQRVTNGITDGSNSGEKYSTLTRNLAEWKKVHTVSCSATRIDMAPVTQSLTVNRGNEEPNIEVQIAPNSTDSEVTLVCLVTSQRLQDYYIAWSESSRKDPENFTDGINLPTQKIRNSYLVSSLYTTTKDSWNRNMFSCNVWPAGSDQAVKPRYVSRFSDHAAPVTVKLSPPSPKAMFSNKQAELKCVVTGQDRSILSDTNISWYINGQQVTNGITDGSNSGEKYSTLTRDLAEWKKVNTVSCSATRIDMAPVTQSLTVNRGNEEPNIEVQIAPNSTDSEVTVVCLVTSQRLQDYYIAWSESSGKDPENFTDGINLPTQKIRNSYLVSSLYTITKDSWNRNMFSCNVWPAGSDQAVKPRYVSRFSDHAAPVTVKLSPPSPKAMFSNKQAELKCVVTGQDRSILSDTNISWYINGQQVTNGITDGSNSGEKYSTLTRDLKEWKKVHTVSCSATRIDMAPVTQSLTVNRGNEEPNIEVQIAPNSTDSEVTLVCLVTSQRLQDYYTSPGQKVLG